MRRRHILTLNLAEEYVTPPESESRPEVSSPSSAWDSYRAAQEGAAELFADPYSRRRSGRFLWLGVSLGLQAAVLGIWLLRSMMEEGALPTPHVVETFVAMQPVVPEPPPPPAAAKTVSASKGIVTARVRRRPERHTFDANVPVVASLSVDDFGFGIDDGIAGGVPGGVGEGLVGSLEPAPAKEEERKVYVGGGELEAPEKLVHVDPVYPEIASSARVQGLVILEATIDGEGNVQNVRVLRSIPILDDAAVEAVRQWKYAPTVVGGNRVPILMTVTVTFSLA